MLPLTVMGSIYTDTEAIIETGCGFGRNIYDLINYGLSSNIDLYCMEYIEGARDAVRVMTKFLVRTHRVTVLPIDYHNADFAVIKAKKYKRVTLTTLTSIEQIPQLPENFIERVLELAPRVDVIHMEPVGWQMRDELRSTTQFSLIELKKIHHHHINNNHQKRAARIAVLIEVIEIVLSKCC